MKFYILNQVWGTNFIPDDSADFGFKIFFIPKTTILLLYRCVWKWFFPKYCHYFSFYDFDIIATEMSQFHWTKRTLYF